MIRRLTHSPAHRRRRSVSIALCAAGIVLGSATIAAAYTSLTNTGSGAARSGLIKAPANFTATSSSPNQATLSWTPPSTPSPTSYTLTQSTGTLAGTCTAITASTTSCTPTGLASGTSYTWTLVANDHTWKSAPVRTSATTSGATTLDLDSYPIYDYPDSVPDSVDWFPNYVDTFYGYSGWSPGAAVTGQPLLVTAKVNGAPEGTTPGGTVTFHLTDKNGTPVACYGSTTQSLHHFWFLPWVATCFIAPGQLLAVDSPYTATAHYSGTSTLAPATGSLKPVQVVNPDPTTTTLTVTKGSSPDPMPNDPSMTGGHLSFTATVSANFPGSGTPQGTVTFVATNHQGQSTTPCNAVTLSNATATCTPGTTLTTGGPYQVTATYAPTPANYLSSHRTWTPPDQQAPVAPTVAPAGGTSTHPGSSPGG